MKVLLILNESLPMQMALWEEVAELDVDLHVVYNLDVRPQSEPAPPTFGTVHQLRVRRVRRDRYTWLLYRGLAATIGEVRPDIVHVLNEPWALIVGQVLAAPVGRVVTHGCENLWDQGALPERTFRRVVTRRNLGRTHGFVSWNDAGVRLARRRGLPESSPTLVLSAVLPRLTRFANDGSRRAAARAALGIDGSFVFGYAGRLVPEKGLDWLLESWSAAELHSDSRLVFVGSGPLESIVRRAAQKDGRIRLHDPVPVDDVPNVMAALDVLVVPSVTMPNWCEQFGRVITEAMAAGVPVIASDSGAIPEVAGDAAMLVPEQSVDALADAMRRVKHDSGLREGLARAGLNRARVEFAPRAKAPTLRSFWDDVMKARSRA